MTRILLVEDDPGLQLTVRDLLQSQGYEVECAGNGDDALALAVMDFGLICLDVMLPGKSGFEICEQMRARGVQSAILMLTARTMVADRVTGLKSGADDYLAKPFDPAELLARVEALLRRLARDGSRASSTLAFDQIEVDFEKSVVLRSGERVALTGKELQLLRYLSANRGRIVPRDEILERVWEYSPDVSSRTVDVHVAWLRQKVERDPQRPEHIQTIRGKGYRFSA